MADSLKEVPRIITRSTSVQHSPRFSSIYLLTRSIPPYGLSKMNHPKFDRVDDITDLTYLNEASVVHNLHMRYGSSSSTRAIRCSIKIDECAHTDRPGPFLLP